jgi:hypothetical protein
MRTRKRSDEDVVTSALHAVEGLIGGKLTTGSLRTPATEAVMEKLTAANFGRLGAAKGGKARAAVLSGRKRKEIARKAARARWAKG